MDLINKMKIILKLFWTLKKIKGAINIPLMNKSKIGNLKINKKNIK